jgi:cobalamin biosynthesis protein CbiD
MSERTMYEVQEAHEEAWRAVEGVVGTGVGACDGEACIKVFVRERTEAVEEAIPSEVEGHPVRIEVTGGFEPLEDA